MDNPVEELRILMLEDAPSDAEMEEIELRDAGLVFTARRVESRAAFEQALDEFRPNIILADYRLPNYNGSDALEYVRRTHPQIPVIMVTGALGDVAAIELLKRGARDYVLKSGLARLVPAITRALSEEHGIRSRKLAEHKLHESEIRYRRLFEAAKDGILILDAETGQIVDANPFILDLLSYRIEECLGKKLWEIGLLSDDKDSKDAFRELQAQGSIRYENLPLETKAGRRRNVEFISNVYEVDGRKVIQCNIRDISERIAAERALRDSEARYKRIIEGLTDYQYSVRIENGRVVETTQSPACATVTGYRAEEFAADPYLWIQMVAPDDREMVLQRVSKVLEGIDVAPMEHRIIRKDGQLRWVSDTVILFKDDSGKLLSYDGVIRDITERKRAEMEINELHRQNQLILDAAGEGIVGLDKAGRCLFANPAATAMLGYNLDELIGAGLHALAHHARADGTPYPKGHCPVVNSFSNGAAIRVSDEVYWRKDGTCFPVEYRSTPIIDGGKITGAVVTFSDISERKRAEQTIMDEKEFSEDLIQSLPDIFYLLDHQGGVVRWNRNLVELAGLSAENMPGSNALEFVHAEDRAFVARQLRAAFETGEAVAEARLLFTNGVRHYVLTATRIESTHGTDVIGVGVDITERKQAEDALRRVNRALKTLSAGNLVLVRATSEEELLQEAAKVIVDVGGHTMAEVDYAMVDDPARRLVPKVSYGPNDSQSWAEHLTWADTELGQLPVSKAMRSGTTQICRNIADDLAFKPWRDAAAQRGFVSNIALPLSGGGKTFGVLSIYSSETAEFDAEEVRLLEELANDLAYGIITLRTRKEHEQHTIVLRQSLEQSIQTIAGTLEARDPYTAGHQRRVAELADAIAREMGLPEDTIDGIHMAAIIHDLGKIQIPAEILSKPGKLSDIEFALVKTHPQTGRDILKNVKFPWPIADIVWQHHERVDGSGYPRGIKGEQILPEAKVIAVADVVEAMASHRPYRPALGIKPALDEVRRGSGSAYDPAAVDACLRLFAEKGFSFSR